MKTLVAKLDELFGYGFISFLRDGPAKTMTVSVTAAALHSAHISPAGWRYVLGARYMIKTLKEAEWERYLVEVVKKDSQ